MMPGMSGPIDWQSLVGVWWEAMGRVCLIGTLILCGAFVLARLLRRVQAGVRCWIWRLAFLKLFLLFGCFFTISLPVFPAKPTVAWSAAKQGKAGSSAADVFRRTPPTSVPGKGAIGKAEEMHAESVGRSGWFDLVSPLLLGIWSLGVLFGLIRLVRQYREASALVRSASPITDPSIQAEFTRVKRALGRRCSPVLVVSELTEVPLLFGILRPTVILPAAIVADFTPEACRMILAHELAHLKRHDLFWSFLTGLALIPCFFHPLVWWTHRELRTLQEICCDEHAIRSIAVSPHAYGEVLVRVAVDPTSSTQNGLISVAMAESSTTIQRRLQEMQTFRVNRGWKRWAPAIAVMIGGAALLPWQLKAQTQTQAQGPEVKELQDAPTPQKTIDKRTIQLGHYILKLKDGEREVQGSFGEGTPLAFYANTSFRLEISANDQGNLMFLEGIENLHAQDESGRVVRGPQGPTSLFELRTWETEKGIARVGVLFQKEAGTKSFKMLEGNLRILPGVLRTFTFAAEELKPGVSKQMGQAIVSIDSVEQGRDGGKIHFTTILPQYTRFNPPGIRTTQGTFGFVDVELVGEAGVTYYDGMLAQYPTLPPQKLPDGIDDGAPVFNLIKSKVTSEFNVRPSGGKTKYFVLRAVEQQGPSYLVPFKFTDITLPDQRPFVPRSRTDLHQNSARRIAISR